MKGDPRATNFKAFAGEYLQFAFQKHEPMLSAGGRSALVTGAELTLERIEASLQLRDGAVLIPDWFPPRNNKTRVLKSLLRAVVRLQYRQHSVMSRASSMLTFVLGIVKSQRSIKVPWTGSDNLFADCCSVPDMPKIDPGDMHLDHLVSILQRFKDRQMAQPPLRGCVFACEAEGGDELNLVDNDALRRHIAGQVAPLTYKDFLDDISEGQQTPMLPTNSPTANNSPIPDGNSVPDPEQNLVSALADRLHGSAVLLGFAPPPRPLVSRLSPIPELELGSQSTE
jgi:hypothetical protein